MEIHMGMMPTLDISSHLYIFGFYFLPKKKTGVIGFHPSIY